MFISKLAAILEESCKQGVLILEGFNACPGDRYYLEWEEVGEYYDLTFSDVNALPDPSVTHVSNAILSGSWLDHYLSLKRWRLPLPT